LAPQAADGRWIEHTRGLVAHAQDRLLPLHERLDFTGRSARNIDAFFMVRVGELAHAPAARGPGATAGLQALVTPARSLARQLAQLFTNELLPALRNDGIRLRRRPELSRAERTRLNDFFMSEVFPVVTPLAVDRGRPFPHISNLSLNIAVMIKGRRREQRHFARVKVPGHLPRFLEVASKGVFVPIEDCITGNLDQLFPGADTLEHHVFRVTRSLASDVEDGSEAC
jgi:polyphosphate kinase